MKSKSASGSILEIPIPGFPQFEARQFEFPTSLQKFAEKRLAQAQDACEEMKSVAEEAATLLEESFATTANRVTTYNRKLAEMLRANTSATMDYACKLLEAKSVAELFELATTHAYHQLELFSEQSKELALLAPKLTVQSTDSSKGADVQSGRRVA